MRAYFVVATVLLAACGVLPTDAVGTSRQGVIVGENDLVPVDADGSNIPARYRPLLDAIGLLEPSGCTAVHVGQGLVLTAGHCVAVDTGDCSEVQVRWAMRGNQEGSTSTCTSVLASQQDADADYVLFRVEPAPPAAIRVDACSEPLPGTPITIFGHPSRRPLEWSNTCMIEPGAMVRGGAHEFAHVCDTEKGSSGAPVIDDVSLRLVGIHVGGLASWNYGTFLSPLPFLQSEREACWCGLPPPSGAQP